MEALNINYYFYTNICEGLRSIRNSEEMSDVTLAVEGKHFKAHQVILSMFSTYFRELFQVTPSRNTIFFMKNVKHRIMHSLLVFMYEGKVQIRSEDFQLFVDTAKELNIKGLPNDMDHEGLMTNADNIEHVIDSASSLKRASEPMVHKAKKHKPGNNKSDQSTSETSVLTLKTNKHIQETGNFNMNGIQLKEEDTDTIDDDPNEMYDFLDDTTNELDGGADNAITSKGSLPVASSQIDHPVLGDMEESDIDEIQSSEEDTEETMAVLDVGPTEMHGLVDETIQLDGNEEDNITKMGNNPLPPPSEGIHGSGTEEKTKRTKEELTKCLEVSFDEKITALFDMVDNLTKEFSEFKKTLRNIEARLQLLACSGSYGSNPLVLQSSKFELPIQNLEGSENINNILHEPALRKTLALELRLAGGCTARQLITAMLRKLFARHVALLYSGRGKKGKLDFSRTNMYPVIVEAVRLRYPDITDQQVSQLIGFSLAAAGDWDGGAKARIQQTAEKESIK